MTLGQRNVARTVLMALALGLTAIACSQTPTDGTKPVVTVYATPT